MISAYLEIERMREESAIAAKATLVPGLEKRQAHMKKDRITRQNQLRTDLRNIHNEGFFARIRRNIRNNKAWRNW